MILAYPCYSVIIKRKAITKPWVIDEMIEKGGLEECRYDDDIITFFAGMNPYDLEHTVYDLNERLGIEILDMTDPQNPKSKDGFIRASLFGGIGSGRGWIWSEGVVKPSGLMSFIPEDASPIANLEAKLFKPYCVRDFGIFDCGHHLSIMRGLRGFFIHFDRDLILPKSYQNNEDACRSMTEDEIVSIMAKFRKELLPDFSEKNGIPILSDFGMYKGWRLALIRWFRGRCVIYKDMRIELPIEYGSLDTVEKEVGRDDAIAILESVLGVYERGESTKSAFRMSHACRERKPNGFTRDVGEYNGSMISLSDGRYGIYLRHGDKNHRLPDEYRCDDAKAQELTLEKAISIINKK